MRRSARARAGVSSQMVQTAPRLLNLRQAAAYLGVSFWTLRDYVIARLLPAVELPALRAREGDRQRQTLRRKLVDVQDLDAFIEANKRRADGESQSRAPENEPINT